MGNLSLELHQALIVFIYFTIALMSVVTVFLVKLLVNTTALIKSLDNLTISIKQELEPTLQEFKKALELVNSVAFGAENHVDSLKKVALSFVESTLGIFGKAKGASSSLFDGIAAGIAILNKFKKKK